MTEAASRRERQKGAPQALETEPRKGADTPLSEWLVAAIGVILVVGSIGFMAYSAVIGESTPPKVLIRQETVIPSGSGFLVTFKAYNKGEATAEAVTIEGTLSRRGSAIETSEVEIDYRSEEHTSDLQSLM